MHRRHGRFSLMNIHDAGRSLVCALVLGLATFGLARADDPTLPRMNDSTLGCEKMMDQAMSMLLKMPEGVDKTVAQKELLSAKVDIDKGDMSGCKAHINNAIGAMTAHNPG
jgi:hypothetical protein